MIAGLTAGVFLELQFHVEEQFQFVGQTSEERRQTFVLSSSLVISVSLSAIFPVRSFLRPSQRKIFRGSSEQRM
jgi:hypothetical protein